MCVQKNKNKNKNAPVCYVIDASINGNNTSPVLTTNMSSSRSPGGRSLVRTIEASFESHILTQVRRHVRQWHAWARSLLQWEPCMLHKKSRSQLRVTNQFSMTVGLLLLRQLLQKYERGILQAAEDQTGRATHAWTLQIFGRLCIKLLGRIKGWADSVIIPRELIPFQRSRLSDQYLWLGHALIWRRAALGGRITDIAGPRDSGNKSFKCIPNNLFQVQEAAWMYRCSWRSILEVIVPF